MVNIKLEETEVPQRRSSQLLMAAKNNIAVIKQEKEASVSNSKPILPFSKLPSPPVPEYFKTFIRSEPIKPVIKTESPEVVIMLSPEPSPQKATVNSTNKQQNIEFQAELTCHICFNPYDEKDQMPINLYPCGHTFCESCLKQIGEKICPSCNSKYTLTTINYALKNMTSKFGPFKYVPKIKELLDKDLVKKFSAANESTFKAQKLFAKNLHAKMNDKIEEINQRNDKIKKAIYREILQLEKHMNSNYQSNLKFCSELNKKKSVWSFKCRVNDENELKNVYQQVTEEFESVKRKHQYIEQKDINSINLVNLDLTEDFLEELSNQIMQFCDENTLEVKFKNLSVKHDKIKPALIPPEQLENVDEKRNMEKLGITDKTIQFIQIDLEYIKRILNRFYYDIKSKKYRDNKSKNRKSKDNPNNQDPLNSKTIVHINLCKSYISRSYANLKPFAQIEFSELRGEKTLMEIFKTSIDLYIKFHNMHPFHNTYHCNMARELNNFINQVSVTLRNMADNTDIFRAKNSKKELDSVKFDFNHGLKT